MEDRKIGETEFGGPLMMLSNIFIRNV